jgi:hemin uptake protein HemP
MIIVSVVSKENRRSAAAERGPLDETTSTSETAIRRVSSRDLLGPKGELIIQHDGREYRLRLTQNGKLILTA